MALVANILATILASPLASIAPIAPNAQSYALPKRVFVYGDYVLDLNRNLERWHPQYTFRVADCSDKEFFCLKALTGDSLSVANIVWPRNCKDISIGEIWSNGKAKSTVYGKKIPLPIYMQDLHSPQNEDIYYIVSPSKTKYVFEYTPRSGITAIIFNSDGFPENFSLDMVAKSKRLPLMTFDPLGACSF